MRQLQEIAQERADMDVIVQLTSAFESIASMRIAQIKSQVLEAQKFFDELWNIYRQIRVDSLFRFGRRHLEPEINKELFIMLSAPGGFSGDIDQRLLSEMLQNYDPAKHDVIVIGHHGTILLTQAGVPFKKYFTLPTKDYDINVEPLLHEIRLYRNTTVYYQTYVSLTVQKVKRIELATVVKELSKHATPGEDIISERNYIFEPNTYDVVAYLERSMLQITLGQVIFDSKLAQYASRFCAMTAANDRAGESLGEVRLLYNRSRRAIHDEQLKEMINGLKKAVHV